MAEEAPHGHEHHGEGEHAHAEAGHAEGAHDHGEEHGSDPMHHIKDLVYLGLAKDGSIRWKPYHHGVAVQGYEPAYAGPLKLEFTKHMFNLGVIALVTFLVCTVVAQRVIRGLKANEAPKGPLANAVEALLVYVRDEVVEPIGGHHLAHYTPLFLTYFFFILIGNLMGMIPEFGGATGNINVTIALAGSVYACVWVLGMANQGVVGYVKHLVPPGTPIPMVPLMFVLELMGPLIKCFVLCVRLFANMIAGHLIVSNVLALGAFGGLLPSMIAGVMLLFGIPLALGISILEILVCFIQAYVFTLLAVIFVGAAVHPEH
ncbi:MAG: F0F1 ATP synthase subunit A [Planctomycetota bacterium]|nr:F0F1 ATP synthase subunit A [Planctomycetota bacterium]